MKIYRAVSERKRRPRGYQQPLVPLFSSPLERWKLVVCGVTTPELYVLFLPDSDVEYPHGIKLAGRPCGVDLRRRDNDNIHEYRLLGET